jgi:hypothetical protein
MGQKRKVGQEFCTGIDSGKMETVIVKSSKKIQLPHLQLAQMGEL